mmetsp:Transcript_100/g.229  ORF Transcript_100/g.229 Transcript_100/m.229 type:complete len:260 (+) Transcript_100:391-1170(+)
MLFSMPLDCFLRRASLASQRWWSGSTRHAPARCASSPSSSELIVRFSECGPSSLWSKAPGGTPRPDCPSAVSIRAMVCRRDRGVRTREPPPADPSRAPRSELPVAFSSSLSEVESMRARSVTVDALGLEAPLEPGVDGDPGPPSRSSTMGRLTWAEGRRGVPPFSFFTRSIFGSGVPRMSLGGTNPHVVIGSPTSAFNSASLVCVPSSAPSSLASLPDLSVGVPVLFDCWLCLEAPLWCGIGDAGKLAYPLPGDNMPAC